MGDEFCDFTVEVRSVGGFSVVALSGDWDLFAKGALHDALSAVGTTSDVIVDARAANFFDSSALGEFIAFFKRLNESGHRFELLIGSSNIERILEMTGLKNVLLPSQERLALLQEVVSSDNAALKRP